MRHGIAVVTVVSFLAGCTRQVTVVEIAYSVRVPEDGADCARGCADASAGEPRATCLLACPGARKNDRLPCPDRDPKRAACETVHRTHVEERRSRGAEVAVAILGSLAVIVTTAYLACGPWMCTEPQVFRKIGR